MRAVMGAIGFVLVGWPSFTCLAAEGAGTVAPTADSNPSALTYGMVTSQVRKGETTQLDLIELFGSPNISTYDSAGIETWVYERTVTQTDVTGNTETARTALDLRVFFGSGQIGGGAGNERARSRAQHTTSLRSITVIVKFDPATGTVSDYRVRSSQF